MNPFKNTQYLIFQTSELSAINFNEVLETSTETVLRSIDGTRALVKWLGAPDDDIPSSLQNLKTRKGPYNHEQILTILQTSRWQNTNNLLLYNNNLLL